MFLIAQKAILTAGGVILSCVKPHVNCHVYMLVFGEHFLKPLDSFLAEQRFS